MKKVLLAGVAAAGLGFATTDAQAAPACGSIQSISDWKEADFCDIGDKRFALIGTNLPGAFKIEFASFGLNYDFAGTTSIIGTFNAYIFYTVEVLDLAFVITAAELDSDVSNLNESAVTTVTKTIYDSDDALLGTLVSSDGSPAILTGLNHTFLKIRDDISVAPGDKLNAFSNTIYQAYQAVPEPTSLALLGMGLLGLGFAARRRKAA